MEKIEFTDETPIFSLKDFGDLINRVNTELKILNIASKIEPDKIWKMENPIEYKASEKPSNCILGGVRQCAIEWWKKLEDKQKVLLAKYYLKNIRHFTTLTGREIEDIYKQWHIA